MTQIIAIANQKGGVGKTTSCINIACGWARLIGPDRVLMVDIDPQANATAVMLGIEVAAGPRRSDMPTIREVLREEVQVTDALHAVELEATGRKMDATVVHVLPAHLELAAIEVEIAVGFRGEFRLRRALEPIVHNYDLIVIDCPPSLGILTLNALVCATDVVIPVDPGVFPLIGLSLLNGTIQQVQEANPHLRIGGVIPTMTMNTVMSRETQEQLVQTYGDLVLPPIPRRVAIEESHVTGVDVFASSPGSDGAQAYANVIEELMNRG